MDEGHNETDDRLKDLERRVNAAYSQAFKEMKAKQQEFMADYEKTLKEKKASLEKGEISNKEFDAWLKDQVTTSDWFNQMVERLSDELVQTDQIAAAMINEALTEAYAINMNWATYQIESAIGISTGFVLYDVSTVQELLLNTPDLLPKVEIDIPKDQRWNRQKLTSAITQSILQGESIPKAAKRVQSVANMDNSAAIRNARTMITAAQNTGRQKSYERASENGINLRKEWVATLDSRTRQSHRRLDGEIVGLNEKFSNGLAFPGDPNGSPSEVYNCRCTMVAALDDVDTSDARRNSKLKGISYEEWKKGLNGRNDQKR